MKRCRILSVCMALLCCLPAVSGQAGKRMRRQRSCQREQSKIRLIRKNPFPSPFGEPRRTVTVVAPGILTITEAAGKKYAALRAGFAEILPDKVTILAEVAEWPEEIDMDRAHAARERAEKRLHDHEAGLDTTRAEIALKKALVRINLRG